MKESQIIYNQFRKDLGKELARIRKEKSLSLEDASDFGGIIFPAILEKIEAGHSARLFLMFRLIDLYGKKLKINLVD